MYSCELPGMRESRMCLLPHLPASQQDICSLVESKQPRSQRCHIQPDLVQRILSLSRFQTSKRQANVPTCLETQASRTGRSLFFPGHGHLGSVLSVYQVRSRLNRPNSCQYHRFWMLVPDPDLAGEKISVPKGNVSGMACSRCQCSVAWRCRPMFRRRQ